MKQIKLFLLLWCVLLLVGCNEDFVVADRHFKDVAAFKIFSEQHPDSAIILLNNDLQRFCSHSSGGNDTMECGKNAGSIDKAAQNLKTLLLAEVSYENEKKPFPDTLMKALTWYYDSVAFSDSLQGCCRSKLQSTQLLRAKAHCYSGASKYVNKTEDITKVMQQYLMALQILDNNFLYSEDKVFVF